MNSILLRLQSTDKTMRDAAENELNGATEMKGLCIEALSTLTVTTNVDSGVCATAAVFFRRSGHDL